MDVATSLIRLALAAVFAVAAGAKALDPAGTRRALEEFGVRPAPARPLTWALPLAEGAIAAGLLNDGAAPLAAAAGAALMLVFGLAVARLLRLGRTPDCNCFGELHSAPLGWPVVARNALLASAALFVALAGAGDPIPAWLSAAVLVAVAGFLLLDARARRAGEPSVGSRAPSVEGRDVHGRRVTLERALDSGLPAALVFVSPDCGPCRTLVPELERWRSAVHGRLTLLTVEVPTSAFRVSATPSALVVAPDGSVATGTATGVAGVQALVRSQLAAGDDLA